MAAPLQDALVDVFMSTLDQQPADHQGPLGRIRSLTNAQSSHFTHSSQFNAAKVALEPRKGFASLSQVVRDTSGNVLSSASWDTSNFLDTIGDQLVAIDEHLPRVYNGYDGWTQYDERIVTNKLREESLIGGDGLVSLTDQCTIGHVQAVSYVLKSADDAWEVWVGFREAPGATSSWRRANDLSGPWTVKPFRVTTEDHPTVAHLLGDGTRFFLIWNSDTDATNNFIVRAYNNRGVNAGSATFSKFDTSPGRSPGWWDVTVDRLDPTRLVHVQPAEPTEDLVDVHVQYTEIWFDGSLKTYTNVDETVICNSYCEWLENRRDDDAYLVTSGPGETNQYLRAYRVARFAPAVTPSVDGWVTGSPGHFSFGAADITVAMTSAEMTVAGTGLANLDGVYTITSVSGTDVEVTPAPPTSGTSRTFPIGTTITLNYRLQVGAWDVAQPSNNIDAITGYVPDVVGDPQIYAIIGCLEASSVTGPQYDPQDRRILTYHVDTGANTSTLVRTSCSQALVSRSTKLGLDWLNLTFYQSGPGLSDGAATIEPTVTAGDYFTGTHKQTIDVQVGGGFAGPDQTFTVAAASTYPFPINVTQNSGGPKNIDDGGTPDQVEYILAPAGLPWLAEGTPCLKWRLKNCTSGTNIFGGRLQIVGSSVSLANHIWDIYGPDGSGIYLTSTTNTVGGDLGSLTAPVVFVGSGGTGGTAECVSLVQYGIPNLGDKYDATTVDILEGTTAAISGNATSANNGNKTVRRAFIGDPAAPFFQRIPCIWTAFTAESSSSSGFTALLQPNNPNVWGFGGHEFASPLVGGSLIIADDAQYPENNSGAIGYEITAVNNAQLTTDAGDTNATRSQVFVAPVPTAYTELGSGVVEFTFFIQDLATELAVNAFRFRGALLQLNSANTSVAGLYQITDVGPDLDGIIYCTRVVQADDIAAYDLDDANDTIQIFLPVASTAPFQPTYFITPAVGPRATVGMFDRLNAYNNWRLNGVNMLFGHLTHVHAQDDASLAFVAPTTQQRVTEANANNQLLQLSTVGIKSWTIQPEYGTAINQFIPGTQAVSFEGDSFPEDGFALAPEAPWLVSQSEAATDELGLQRGATYVYTIVVEGQDRAGNRVYSPPSPPLIVGPLAGDNNVVTIGGDLPLPWDTTATSPSDTYGVTNRSPVTISIYRSSYRNGVETMTQFKITNDLRPNALAPISDDNASGFSFTNGQFTYVDQNPDLTVQTHQQLYSNTALPRFGAPAFTDGEFWNDRYWLIASDGSIWFSTAVTDGVRPSFFPGFRIAPPPTDRPVAVRGLGQFLIVLCERSIFYLPATALPSASLAEVGQVTIPGLVPLPFSNGCTGQAITTPAGVMYASTAGGIWNVTRSLTNDFVSQPMVDTFKELNAKIQGLAIDRDQRLAVTTGDAVLVFDFISGLWASWLLAVQDVTQVAVYAGRFVGRAGEFVLQQTDDAFDQVDSILYPINWQAVLAGIGFGSVRAFARLRRMQVIGEYRAPHNMQVTFGYPDDFPDDPTTCPVLVPTPGDPYLIEAIPAHGRASQIDVTIDVNHDGQEVPGDSCSIEVLSCKVGVQPGQRQVPSTRRV